jgi:hypothetical protein
MELKFSLIISAKLNKKICLIFFSERSKSLEILGKLQVFNKKVESLENMAPIENKPAGDYWAK